MAYAVDTYRDYIINEWNIEVQNILNATGNHLAQFNLDMNYIQSIINSLNIEFANSGKPLCSSFINCIFEQKAFTANECNNVVIGVLKYVAQNLLMSINAANPNFGKAYDWVIGNLPAVQRWASLQQQQLQQPYQPQQQFVNQFAPNQIQQPQQYNSTWVPSNNVVNQQLIPQQPFQQSRSNIGDNMLKSNHTQSSLNGLPPTAVVDFSPYQKELPQIQNVVAKPQTSIVLNPKPIINISDKKVTVFDKRDAEGTLESAEVYQITNVLNLLLELKYPTITTLYSNRTITVNTSIINTTEDDLELTLEALIANCSEINYFLTAVLKIENNNNVVCAFATFINRIGHLILLHRFGLNSPLPYLSKTKETEDFLNSRGIKNIVDKLLLKAIKEYFFSIKYADLCKEDSETKKVLDVINRNTVIVIPEITYYSSVTKELKCAVDLNLQDVYKQAFELLNDEFIFLDIYDISMNRYRVYKEGMLNGIDGTFIVESMI